MKQFGERGLDKSGIKLIATGDVTDDDQLNDMGDVALGVVNSHHYSAAHPSPTNKKFVQAFEAANKFRPNFMAVAGYDGMHVIYNALATTKGAGGGDALLAAMKGQIFESPRGPILIDAQTRDIVQDVYIRKVEHVRQRASSTTSSSTFRRRSRIRPRRSRAGSGEGRRSPRPGLAPGAGSSPRSFAARRALLERTAGIFGKADSRHRRAGCLLAVGNDLKLAPRSAIALRPRSNQQDRGDVMSMNRSRRRAGHAVRVIAQRGGARRLRRRRILGPPPTSPSSSADSQGRSRRRHRSTARRS